MRCQLNALDSPDQIAEDQSNSGSRVPLGCHRLAESGTQKNLRCQKSHENIVAFLEINV